MNEPSPETPASPPSMPSPAEPAAPPPPPPAPPAAAGPPAQWRWPAVHQEGWPFAGAAGAAALVALLFGWTSLFWLLLALTLAIAAFFRDPERVTPPGDDSLVSPADGLVVQVAEADIPRQLVAERGLAAGRATRVSIFLSVFDVHVNRTPIAGTVTHMAYVPGAFVNASLDKASDENERAFMVVEALDGTRVGVAQIAGLVARRIVSFVREGAMLAPGQRYGLIRFGSRADIYLPEGWRVTVLKGQRAVAGETVIASRGPAGPANG